MHEVSNTHKQCIIFDIVLIVKERELAEQWTARGYIHVFMSVTGWWKLEQHKHNYMYIMRNKATINKENRTRNQQLNKKSGDG